MTSLSDRADGRAPTITRFRCSLRSNLLSHLCSCVKGDTILVCSVHTSAVGFFLFAHCRVIGGGEGKGRGERWMGDARPGEEIASVYKFAVDRSSLFVRTVAARSLKHALEGWYLHCPGGFFATPPLFGSNRSLLNCYASQPPSTSINLAHDTLLMCARHRSRNTKNNLGFLFALTATLDNSFVQSREGGVLTRC